MLLIEIQWFETQRRRYKKKSAANNPHPAHKRTTTQNKQTPVMQGCGQLCADCSRRALWRGVATEVPGTEMDMIRRWWGPAEKREPEKRVKIVEHYKGWIIEITPCKFSEQWMGFAKKESDDIDRKFKHIQPYGYTKKDVLAITKKEIDAVINGTSTPPPTSPAQKKTPPPARTNPVLSKGGQVEFSKRKDPKNKIKHQFSQRIDPKRPLPPVSSTIPPPSVSGNNGLPPVSKRV
jgi:hypothetical protein